MFREGVLHTPPQNGGNGEPSSEAAVIHLSPVDGEESDVEELDVGELDVEGLPETVYPVGSAALTVSRGGPGSSETRQRRLTCSADDSNFDNTRNLNSVRAQLDFLAGSEVGIAKGALSVTNHILAISNGAAEARDDMKEKDENKYDNQPSLWNSQVPVILREMAYAAAKPCRDLCSWFAVGLFLVLLVMAAGWAWKQVKMEEHDYEIRLRAVGAGVNITALDASLPLRAWQP